MLTRRVRLVALALVASTVVVAAVAVYLLLPPRQTGDVAVPPDTATPEQVVTAYLDALNLHDCDTARALMTDDAVHQATSWCTAVASLGGVTVHDHVPEPPAYSGRSDAEEVVTVPVDLDLRWRPLRSDGSLDEGPTPWGYRLVRDGVGSAWRVFDQGHG